MARQFNNYLTGIRDRMTGQQSILFLINSALFIAGILLLIGPAIQNGFPILHADSGTYLLEGFGTKIPVSRPLSYCLFVRFTSRIFSIWSVVVTQAIIAYWTIWLAVNTLAGKKKIAWLPFITVALLSVTTGISFYVSQIMTDIFMPVALLGLFILVVRERMPWYTWLFLGLIVWLSLIVHMSNLPVLTGLAFAIIILKIILEKSIKPVKQLSVYIIAGILVISWLTNPLISTIYGEGFRTSNSGNIVFFSRLLQAGAAQKYIKDRCEKEPEYYLCEYKDQIDTYDRLDKFLWPDTSFLYDHPCREKTWDYCWRVRNQEFGEINSAILDHPPSRNIYLKAVWDDFQLALHAFGLTGYVSFREGSHIDYPLKRYYTNDYKSFKNSRQYAGTMVFRDMNRIIHFVVWISLALAAFLIIRNRRILDRRSPYLILMSILVLTWLGNALLTAFVAVVSERFLGRFIWLLPFFVIMLVYREYSALYADSADKAREE